MYTNNQSHHFEETTEDDSRKYSSNGCEESEDTNHSFSYLIAIQERLKLEKSKTDKEWQKSDEYRLHSEMVEKSKQVSLFKCIGLYFQWYIKLVSEKHADKFTQRIADINKESSEVGNGYTISVVDNNLALCDKNVALCDKNVALCDNNVALGLLGFQLHHKDALENGEVCMGFCKHEVDGQYGITVESLFTLNAYAKKYMESGIRTYGDRSRCIVSELITRMKSTEYRAYQCKFNQNMVQIIYKTLEIVSNLTTPGSELDVKLQEALRILGGEISNATSMQMEKEWQNSRLCTNDLSMVIAMREAGIYKNVYDQYHWYLDQVFKKHSEQFRTYMKRINDSKQMMYGECTTLQDVVRFQDEYQRKIIGRRGGVYMGFSKDNVKEQFGLSLESLLIFMSGAECYRKHRVAYSDDSSTCLIAQLKTRMLCNDNIQRLNRVDLQLPSVLSEVISNITTTSDTPC